MPGVEERFVTTRGLCNDSITVGATLAGAALDFAAVRLSLGDRSLTTGVATLACGTDALAAKTARVAGNLGASAVLVVCSCGHRDCRKYVRGNLF